MTLLSEPISSPSSGTGAESAALGQGDNRSPDAEQVIAHLRSKINNGKWKLEASLLRLTEAAQLLTGASGAAVAIRQNGVVTCQARVGELAPEQGTPLDSDSGISGECLRTGETLRCEDADKDPRLDPELCRTLGLRSLAVVPLGNRSAVIGVLAVFSTNPHSFPDRSINLLEQLADLVVAARLAQASKPSMSRRISSAVSALVSSDAWSRTRQGLASLSENLSGRRMALAGAALVVVIAALGWVSFRRSADKTSSPASAAQVAIPPVETSFPSPAAGFVYNGNELAETVSPKRKPSPSVVQAGGKTEKTSGARDLVRPAVEVKSIATPAAATPAGSQPMQSSATRESAPVLASVAPNPVNIPVNVLAVPVTLPTPGIPVSQGIVEGKLERRVTPVYPPMARAQGIEGRVVLRGTVAEDGTLDGLKVVSGVPMLARAALDAVAQWRYRPYTLNGKPVRMPTEISVEFKLP